MRTDVGTRPRHRKALRTSTSSGPETTVSGETSTLPRYEADPELQIKERRESQALYDTEANSDDRTRLPVGPSAYLTGQQSRSCARNAQRRHLLNRPRVHSHGTFQGFVIFWWEHKQPGAPALRLARNVIGNF